MSHFFELYDVVPRDGYFTCSGWCCLALSSVVRYLLAQTDVALLWCKYRINECVCQECTPTYTSICSGQVRETGPA